MNSKYNYKENFLNDKENLKSKNNQENDTNEEYDKNYIFDLPRSKWYFEDENFIQKHTMRIEVEKLNKRLYTSRLILKSMRITDIDLALRGNRHVKMVEENKLK